MASMTTSTDPFPPRAASQMHFVRLRLYCFSRPALFSKEPLSSERVRWYCRWARQPATVETALEEKPTVYQYLCTYVHALHLSFSLRLRQSKHTTPQHSLRPRQLQPQLVDVLSHCSQYTFQFHHLLIRISLPHSTRMRFRLQI